MIEDMKPQAASNVKTGLVLDAVAKAEGLEVSDEEIEAAVAADGGGRPGGSEGLRDPASQEW